MKLKINRWALGHGAVTGLLVGWAFRNNNNFWPTLVWLLIGLAYFTGDHRGKQAMHTKIFEALNEQNLRVDMSIDELLEMTPEDDMMYVINGKALKYLLNRIVRAM